MSKNLSDIFPPTEIGGGGGGIEEAPKTGKLHGRKDGAWEEFDPGQLETGNQDGEILTWDTAAAKWVDDDRLMVSDSYVTYAAPSGDAGMIVQARSGNELISQTRYHSKNVAGTNVGGAIGHDGTNLCLSGATSLTAAKHVQIDATGNATFSGTVNANALTTSSIYRSGAGGIAFTSGGHVKPVNGQGVDTNATNDLGVATVKFKDAHFSGTVNATTFNGVNFHRAGVCGIGFTATGGGQVYIAPSLGGSGDANGKVDFGASGLTFRDAHFSGTVNAGVVRASGRGYFEGMTHAGHGLWNTHCGIAFSPGALNPLDSTGAPTNGPNAISIGTSANRWQNAFFSGTVNATTINGRVTDVADHIKNITPTQIANWDAGTGGGGGATTDGRISDTDIIHWNEAWDWGDHSQANYQPAGNYATAGTSYTKAESDAKYELKGAGGLPAGDWHCSGSITAEGNITAYSSSDERLKDDIAPMPLGLIDGINPVTFKWKDSGKSSGGVIAQQLQACGLGDWVNEAPNGDLGVDYNALVGVLLAEVLELKARVREMENANANP